MVFFDHGGYSSRCRWGQGTAATSHLAKRDQRKTNVSIFWWLFLNNTGHICYGNKWGYANISLKRKCLKTYYDINAGCSYWHSRWVRGEKTVHSWFYFFHTVSFRCRFWKIVKMMSEFATCNPNKGAHTRADLKCSRSNHKHFNDVLQDGYMQYHYLKMFPKNGNRTSSRWFSWHKAAARNFIVRSVLLAIVVTFGNACAEWASNRQTLLCLLTICNQSGLFAKRGLNQRICFTPLVRIHFTSDQSTRRPVWWNPSDFLEGQTKTSSLKSLYW